MDLGLTNMALAVGAGLASVMSPCVLPVVPVIMAGAEREDRWRPMIIVAGLALSFMTMGAVSSLFGALLVGRTRTIEAVGAVIITLLGLMVLFDASVFKRLTRLSNIRVAGEGRWSGLALGMALGVVWVPCIGPFLSSILTMVGTSGRLAGGVFLLGLYSLGLAIPMLAVAYSSHIIQRKLRAAAQHEAIFRYVSGGILVVFGLYSLIHGNVAF
jgi:cytochrome c-type biogenesis protein